MKWLYRLRVLTAAASLLVIATSTSSANATPGQPGTLDATFATGSALGPGKFVTPVGNSTDYATALVRQPDGKLVLAGYCLVGTTWNFCVTRLHGGDVPGVAGTLDTTFNGSGTVVTAVSNVSHDYAYAVALQADGKIVVAGSCPGSIRYDFCAVRYTSLGKLDTSFGNGGKVITNIGSANDQANAIVVQPDGKLVLAGRCDVGVTLDFCMLRYETDGTLDRSFGAFGKTTSAVGSGDDIAIALALQPDGKLVLAGYCDGENSPDFCVRRYLANGGPDTDFGTNGWVITPVGSGRDIVTSLVIQPDDKLVVAGYCSTGASDADFCAVRYLPTGVLDSTFGSSGKVITPVGVTNDAATTMVRQPDGKLVLAGYCDNGPDFSFCAVRYHANGSIDTSFGSGGKIIQTVSGLQDVAVAVVLQPDGKLVLGGYCTGVSNSDFCTVRLDGGPFGYKNCALDIDGDGRILSTTDSLIITRLSNGMTGPAVINGINFPTEATRKTWPLIRDYLVTQCGMSLVP